MRKKILFTSLVVIVMVILTGCKSAQDRAAEKAVQVGSQGQMAADINHKQQRVKFTNKTGDSSLELDNNGNLQAPQGWPKELEVYKGAKIISNLINHGNIQFIAKTNDSVSKVEIWYKKELLDDGWTSVSAMNMGDTWLGSYKKDGQQVSITISSNEDGEGYLIHHNYTPSN